MLDFESLLLVKISNFLYEVGFTLDLPRKLFYKKIEVGFQYIIPSVSQYEEEALAEIHLGVRQELVEDLAQPFSQTLQIQKDQTFTLLTSEGRLCKQPYKRYNLKTEEDLENFNLQFQAFYEQKGKGFLEEISTLDNLDSLVNQNPEKVHPYFFNQFQRCIKGLCVARLNQNSDFEKLAETYHQLLQQKRIPQQQIKLFENLWGYLKNFSLN